MAKVLLLAKKKAIRTGNAHNKGEQCIVIATLCIAVSAARNTLLEYVGIWQLL